MSVEVLRTCNCILYFKTCWYCLKSC